MCSEPETFSDLFIEEHTVAARKKCKSEENQLKVLALFSQKYKKIIHADLSIKFFFTQS
jgi:hypothetical protein